MPIRKPTTKAGKKKVMADEMRRFKKGELHSGSAKGPKVKDRKQAVAIAMHEAGDGKRTSKDRAATRERLKDKGL